ncbi:MAG: hypothetical protein WCX73_03245 [Candidatus Pacearchaeota archaeon]|jgi:hypothetical protein
MSDKEIYLNLNKVELVGWEYNKSFDKVARFVEDIKKGDSFPSVPVKKIKDNLYSLIYISERWDFIEDGGHNRAVAHYITNKSLKCNLVGKGLPVPQNVQVSINIFLYSFNLFLLKNLFINFLEKISFFFHFNNCNSK